MKGFKWLRFYLTNYLFGEYDLPKDEEKKRKERLEELRAKQGKDIVKVGDKIIKKYKGMEDGDDEIYQV